MKNEYFNTRLSLSYCNPHCGIWTHQGVVWSSEIVSDNDAKGGNLERDVMQLFRQIRCWGIAWPFCPWEDEPPPQARAHSPAMFRSQRSMRAPGSYPSRVPTIDPWTPPMVAVQRRIVHLGAPNTFRGNDCLIPVSVPLFRGIIYSE